MIPWTSPNPKVQWPHPLWVRADCSDGDSLQAIIHEDEYRLRELPWHPGAVVIDVGAYIGAVSALCLSLGARRVVAVEPLRSNCELIWRNMAAWGNPRFSLYHRAASPRGEPRTVYFREQGSDYGHRNRYVALTEPMEPDQLVIEDVPGIDLNELIGAESHSSDIFLLKIDCEGAEWGVLEALQPTMRQRVERIVMEVHSPLGTATAEACFERAQALLPEHRLTRTHLNDMWFERK